MNHIGRFFRKFRKENKFFLLVIGVFLFNTVLISQSHNNSDGINGNLVSVDWLEKNLTNKNVLIVDASNAMAYSKQHIPGAVNLDMFAYGGKEFPVQEVEQRLQSLGISKEKKIVLYDRDAPMMAARIFYDLCYYGFPVNNLFILNGGFSKWQETGKAVSSEPTKTEKRGNYKIAKLNESVRVKLPEFLTASADQKNNVLLEALDANWHYGQLQVFDRPGHIPFSVLMPRADFFNPDKTFKSAEEIKKMLDYFGINSKQNILTYCGGGIAASVPFFALKFILGFPNVKLFSESELGWLQDERMLPLWTYDAPYIIRNADWIKSWGGRMMRMYDIARVSLVDVRNADDFYKGHIPFALNVPIDLLKSNLLNEEKMKELLSAAGVNSSHEAVIISENGLNESSALAFLLLNYLGQNKVSVFVESYEKGGIVPTKDTTALGPKKFPQDLSIPLTIYKGNTRKEVLIFKTEDIKGVSTRIFISSGKNKSDKFKDGKVISLPFTDFSTAGGQPKPAKDIWNILQTAGVPMYTELICFADNPGEAAINYFILKLMGFVDVKVMVI
jgi:3-mercaptopyruvate sulfurtransferase SseA